MSNVDTEKVQELLEAMGRANPEMKIIGRDEEGWHKKSLSLWFIWVGMAILDVIMPAFAKRWRERYTVVTPNHMAFPRMPQDLTVYSTYSVLRHEYVHMRDRLAHPIWFPVSYALFFPAIWTMRAHWEMRGYTANMIVAFEESGQITDATVDWIVKQFTTSRYFWMWPFESRVRARVEELRAKVLAGELSGLYF